MLTPLKYNFIDMDPKYYVFTAKTWKIWFVIHEESLIGCN